MAGRGAAGTEDKFRTRRFEIHGTAAYDVRSTAPQRRPVVLPEEKEVPVRVRRVRASVRVSPFVVLGAAAAVFLAALVIFGYVRLYVASSQVSDLEQQSSALEQERSRLESKYENQISLAEVEEQAEALGMTKPKAGQTVSLNLGGGDHAEITPAEHTNILAAAYHAIRDSITAFLEYLS